MLTRRKEKEKEISGMKEEGEKEGEEEEEEGEKEGEETMAKRTRKNARGVRPRK